MSKDILRYDLMIENALRAVVRESLIRVSKDGLPGEHHFYITFLTQYPGVKIPDYLHEKYPDEMTIVLQHQFFGLSVDDQNFVVMLSFNNVRERLEIPLAAISTFVDPSVNFALQFQSMTESSEEEEGKEGQESLETDKKDEETKRGEVISLDKFRKK